MSEDPNDYVIHLFRATVPSSGPKAVGSSSGVSGRYKQIGPGINSVGFTGTTNGRHGKMVRGTHLSRRLGILRGSSTMILWFGAEIIEAKTTLAKFGERLEASAQLAGANLLNVVQQIEENNRRDDRQDKHLESVDARVRDGERRR